MAALTEFRPYVWSSQLIVNTDKAFVFGGLVNRKYEGEIRSFGQVLKISEIGDLSVSNYSEDTNITYATLTGANRDLVIDQQKYVAFTVDDVLRAQVKVDAVSGAMTKASYALADTIDQAIAAKYADAGISTSGLGTASSSLSLYGAHTSSASNMLGFLSRVNRYMDEANCPSMGRWIVVPPWLKSFMLYAQIVDKTSAGAMKTPYGLSSGTGFVGEVAGLNVFASNNVSTNGTTQWRVMFGTSDAISFAGQIVKTEMGRHENKFGEWVRMLYVYGIKVARPDRLGVAYVDDAGLST